MKLWKLTIEIESEDEFNTAEEILTKLDLEANRGDGIYLMVDSKKTKVKFLKEIPDDE
jgi:hypothetical protein